VHRPRYEDWSLPKGKLDPGETLEQAALREVEEETGWRCQLGPHVGKNEYRDRHGRSKRVDWWLMDPVDGEFHPNDEVDEIRWVPIADVRELLTHEDDYGLIEQAGLA
jgi:8-oxo-dGTP diphosphatase